MNWTKKWGQTNLESIAGDLKENSALLIDVGNDNTKYFSLDAAQWLTKRKISLFGSNTSHYDSGFMNPTGFFVELFMAEIPIIANLTNFHLLPRTNFTVIAIPLKINGLCTVPCRVIALIHSSTCIRCNYRN